MEEIPTESVNNSPEADSVYENEIQRNHAVQLQRAQELYGVPADIEVVIGKTLDHHSLTPIEDSPLPDAEDYIVARMNRDDFPGYNYVNFMKTAGGEIVIVKMGYGPENTEEIDGEKVRVGGLRQEHQVIQALQAEGYQMPQTFGYYPSYPEGSEPNQAELLEMLVLEAVPPEVGAEYNTEDWTPGLAKIAAQKIRTFARHKADIDLFKDAKTPIKYEDLKDRATSWIEGEGDYAKALEGVEAAYPYLDEASQIIVHGDTWPRNVIVRHDQEDMVFVDWELAAPGYKGQDAARMLWGLTLDNNWRFPKIGEKADAFIDEWCNGEGSDEESAATLRFGVIFESLRWISDRQRDINNPETDEATRISLASEIADVKAHALEILSRIEPAFV